MPPRTAATTSSAALALADEPNSSGEAVPPLAFDTEDELRAVLDRLRDDLRGRVKERCEGAEQKGSKGKGRAQPMSEADRKKVDDLVLKQFYTKVESIIASNCTIAGHSYSDYQKKKKRGELGKTQPVNDELHQRVLNYQNELFDAREINAQERVAAPARAGQYVKGVVDLDKEYLAKLEDHRLDVPEELALPKPRSRKSLGGAAGSVEAPSAAQAQEYYEHGRQALDHLLEEVPKLTTAAEEARKVALDAAALE